MFSVTEIILYTIVWIKFLDVIYFRYFVLPASLLPDKTHVRALSAWKIADIL